MITTRTRVFSILATVAMLVSMLTCFVIPASADELEEMKAPYAALLEDVSGAAILKEAMKTVTAVAELETALEADVAAGTITWPEYAYGTKDYPRYAYKAVYVAAGYTGNVWSISEVEDWLDMIDASATDTFAGNTFHLTNDIDFDATPEDPETNVGVQMAPLNYCDGKDGKAIPNPFQGTIEGHNYAFKNVNVYKNIEAETAVANVMVGLISHLGNYACIREFGVESGTIKAEGNATNCFVSTFGEPLNKNEAAQDLPFDESVLQMKNVWSGANIIAAASGTNNANGIICHGQNSRMILNGAYFCGTLTANNASDAEQTLGIAFTSSRIYAYNTLSGVEGCAAYAMRNNSTIVNARALGGGYDTAGLNECVVTNAAVVDSVLQAAYEINAAQNAEQGFEEVYFTQDGNGGIRFGTKENAIVKYSYTIDGVEQTPVYANPGSVDLRELLGLQGMQMIESALIGGVEAERDSKNGKNYIITGDVNVTVVYDTATPEQVEQLAQLQAQLADALGPYSSMDGQVLKNAEELGDGKVGLADINAFMYAADVENSTAGKLAQLQSAVAIVGNLKIEVSEIYPNFPAYKYHETYESYQPASGTNWLIVDEDDWDEMDNVAKNAAAGARYFEGVTFHLKDNVVFDYDTARIPLGANGAGSSAEMARMFAGELDGHGYGFESIYINFASSTKANAGSEYDAYGSFGLFAYLGGCYIHDFGINSGWIQAGTGNNRQSATTFGCIPVGGTTAEDPLVLENVWNHGVLYSSANCNVSGLFGSYGRNNSYDMFATVNGAVLDGGMYIRSNKTAPLIAGLFAGWSTKPTDASSLTFSNVIVSADMSFVVENPGRGETFETRAEPAYTDTTTTLGAVDGKSITMIGLGSAEQFNAANFRNVYGVATGEHKVLSGAVVVNSAYKALDLTVLNAADTVLLTQMSALEAAYTSNSEQAGVENPVYFTLKNGNLYPTSEGTNMVIKVTIGCDGFDDTDLFTNAGVPVTKADLAARLGISANEITEVITEEVEVVDGAFTPYVDMYVTVVASACSHAETTIVPFGPNQHQIICNGVCGEVLETVDCTFDHIHSGETTYVEGVLSATYTGTCSVPGCGNVVQGDCAVIPHEATCGENMYFEFPNCDRPTYVVENSASDHSFEGALWAFVEEGSAKQYRECVGGCGTKEYRYLGSADVVGAELKALENGVITVTLPVALSEATLTFSVPAGYTIAAVEGATAGDGYYTVANTEAGAVITITLESDITAVGGAFGVTITNAKANDDVVVTDVETSAEIVFVALQGDANGDKSVNLSDALALLYSIVDPENSAAVNAANANADVEDVALNVNDVYAIVRIWLRDTIFA